MDALPLPPLSSAQADLVARMAELARTRFAPRAARYDAESSFPYENYRDLHAAGLLPLTIPAAYGGVGADPIAYVHALREMARGCSATALTFNMHSTITGFIEALGTEAHQAKAYAAQVGLDATTRALQMAGGRGILKELPLERWHRDALAGPVMPPSNDRCLETAGKLLCGLRAATLEFQ